MSSSEVPSNVGPGGNQPEIPEELPVASEVGVRFLESISEYLYYNCNNKKEIVLNCYS